MVAIAMLAVMAQFWINQRQQSSMDRVNSILRSQLVPVNDSIGTVIDEYSFAIQRQLNGKNLSSKEDCVEVTRSPLVKSLIVTAADRELLFPSNLQNLSTDDMTLLDEALQLIKEEISPLTKGQTQQYLSPNSQYPLDQLSQQSLQSADNNIGAQSSEPASQSYQSRIFPSNRRARGNSQRDLSQDASQQVKDESNSNSVTSLQNDVQGGQVQEEAFASESAKANQEDFGWITWYHRRNLVLAFWLRDSDERTAMIIMPGARWTADLVAILPEMQSGDSPNVNLSGGLAGGRLNQLVDIEGNNVYQWGDAAKSSWETLVANSPSAEIAVANPLEGWRLRVFATEELERQLAGDDLLFPIWLAVAGISLALILTGLLATVTLNRTMHLARTRVSFVNHVSHELRTPLTNICMYADLLAGDIDADSSQQQLGRISVIQNESRRLNRLINNVLQFARSGTREKPLQPTSCNLNSLIDEVLETFGPSLSELEFEIETDLQTQESRLFDRGAVEQILVNLIGNAEKYAAGGKYLRIRTSGDDEFVTIEIQDEGPGVPDRLSKRIFAPFERVSDKLADPAGTGIGLPISRSLCRKHGGDCRLLKSSVGALFCCTLKAPLERESRDS